MLYCFSINSPSRVVQKKTLRDIVASQLSASLCQALVDNDHDSALKLLDHQCINQFINVRTKREQLQRYTVPNEHRYIREVSPMFVAITDAPLNLMARMKDLGASLWELSSSKENALHVICYSNVETLVKCEYLIRQDKTLIDRENLRGDLPLHTAAYCGRSSICDAFINYGAELNADGCDMRTSLHMAIFGYKPYVRHRECVALLLERGVNIFARDVYDRTASELLRGKDCKGNTQFL